MARARRCFRVAIAVVASVIATAPARAQDSPDTSRAVFCTEIIHGSFDHDSLRSFPERDFAVVQTERLRRENRDVLRIDADFSMVPFGLPPLPYYEVDPDGRVIAVDGGSVYGMPAGEETFTRIIYLEEKPFLSFQLRRDPASGAVLVNRNDRTYPDNWMVVRGDRLEPWPEWTQLRRFGAEALNQVIEEPLTGTLIALGQESDGKNEDVYARGRGGRWSKVYTLRKTWASFYIGVPWLRARFLPGTGLIAIVTHAEAFTIDPTVDPPKAENVLVGVVHLGPGHLMASAATEGLLLLDKNRLMPDGSASDLYHLTGDGLVPVPGGTVRIEDPRVWNYLTDLPSIGRVAVAAEGRLWLYDGAAVREVEGYRSAGRGEKIHWRDHPAIGRVLGRSVIRLYTLSHEGEIEAVDVPFSLEWGPGPDGPRRREELAGWPSENVVIAMTREGTFLIDRDLAVTQIDTRPLNTRAFANEFSVDVAAGRAFFAPLREGILGLRARDRPADGTAPCD